MPNFPLSLAVDEVHVGPVELAVVDHGFERDRAVFGRGNLQREVDDLAGSGFGGRDITQDKRFGRSVGLAKHGFHGISLRQFGNFDAPTIGNGPVRAKTRATFVTETVLNRV
jgi:hypothetical protein